MLWCGLLESNNRILLGTLSTSVPSSNTVTPSLALKYNIFKQVSTRIELPDGSKTFGKTINNDPTKYFTKDILEKLDAVCGKEFKYGDVIETELPEATQDDQS